MSRRDARLAAIAAARSDLVADDTSAQAEDWNEASAFNADARNDAWQRLDRETAATLAI